MRRGAALVVACAAFVVWTTSHVLAWPRPCRQELAAVGKSPTVEVCGPMGADGLLGAVLLIAVLLLPDVSELAIPNLITLKRRVERQAEEQGRLRDDLARVEQVQLAQQKRECERCAVRSSGLGSRQRGSSTPDRRRERTGLRPPRSSRDGSRDAAFPPRARSTRDGVTATVASDRTIISVSSRPAPWPLG